MNELDWSIRRTCTSLLVICLIIIGIKYQWFNSYIAYLKLCYTSVSYYCGWGVILAPLIGIFHAHEHDPVELPKPDPNLPKENTKYVNYYAHTINGHKCCYKFRETTDGPEFVYHEHATDLCHKCIMKRNKMLTQMGLEDNNHKYDSILHDGYNPIQCGKVKAPESTPALIGYPKVDITLSELEKFHAQAREKIKRLEEDMYHLKPECLPD